MQIKRLTGSQPLNGSHKIRVNSRMFRNLAEIRSPEDSFGLQMLGFPFLYAQQSVSSSFRLFILYHSKGWLKFNLNVAKKIRPEKVAKKFNSQEYSLPKSATNLTTFVTVPWFSPPHAVPRPDGSFFIHKKERTKISGNFILCFVRSLDWCWWTIFFVAFLWLRN